MMIRFAQSIEVFLPHLAIFWAKPPIPMEQQSETDDASP
jgi:hypothetical protein